MELQIAEYIAAHRSAELTALMRAITSTGTGLFPVIVFGLTIIYFLLRHKRFHEIILIGLSLCLGQLTGVILKGLFMRARPPFNLAVYAESGYAMPSMHAILAACFYGMLFLQLGRTIAHKTWRRIFWAFGVLFILLLGFSRIYLGVHWVSDVIAGFAIGVALNWGLLLAYDQLLRKNTLKKLPGKHKK